ncbi:DHA2 family efflux MFS transporter permease subunit [Pseudomonas sp. BN414]|uniref:DHA2 family efflux MFS transporter permease subunit n=1 Tax=Pseudomonas sp. BN414 TaxID=2567888 RepID=UPI002457DCA6|nr:DHA2 family efflux MFS transporter permease subunit [Pseudomonas sp. BN414]MDH4565239.1 DHA2 family efflux MFS transporter permease subunit [Pseudomonas sp. BN414]
MDSPLPQQNDSRRGVITLSVMLATIMQALDTTIANVALPHVQGTMGTTQEQINWVLTSYVIAAAIFTPLTGFLASRFGRKRIFIWSIIGFTLTSMLCGAAQTLEQIVLFRVLQGIFGASLVPLSQSLLLDTYPREKHGSAMAMWGVGVMVGPILGPTLGGWLTEYYSWRWVFYINLPFGVLAWLGMATSVKETIMDTSRKFDLLGFSLLALAIGAFQLMLDRGESLDWFASREILMEAFLAGLCLYLFIVHTWTHQDPFINPKLFKDRNFCVGLFFIFLVGIVLLATMALLPPFMQNLMGYPVLDVGYVLAPRGLGTMLAMLLVGRLIARVDPRLLLVAGLLLTGLSLWDMTLFTTETSTSELIRSGVIQGFGLGLIFTPLTTISFSTLAPAFRNDGTALYSLLRNVGSGIGISIVITYLGHRTQINHEVFSSYLTPFSQPLQQAVQAGAYNLNTPAGLMTLDRDVTRQASTLAYLQDFRLMMFITLAAIPMTLFLRAGRRSKPELVMD